MAHFLFQPDPIDDVEFRAIKIDIHLGVVKIEQEDTMETMVSTALMKSWLALA